MCTQINATDVGALSSPEELTKHLVDSQIQRSVDSLRLEQNRQTKTQILHNTDSVATFAARKLPSGGSVRSAFITLELKDEQAQFIWATGRSNEATVITVHHGQPIAGECWWWQAKCAARRPIAWQPRHQKITTQNQAQIYQELITNAAGQLTTSFLSINGHPKDNRLQPHGFLPEAARFRIAAALGDRTPLHGEGFPVDQNMASAVAPEGEAAVDPDYQNGSGMDRLEYVVTGLAQEPASVEATLSYQSIPPFYQQDRYCTVANADGTPIEDTARLRWLAAHLRLEGTGGEGWRVVVGTSTNLMKKANR